MSQLCHDIHDLVRGLPRHTIPIDADQIPTSGVYILFEAGEQGHDGDRIVRIGTHSGVNNLRKRLNEHFVAANKDRSIFRKNIGRALLNRDKDPFLAQWDLDLTTTAARLKNAAFVDKGKLLAVENRVTDYIRSRFGFAVVECVGERACWELSLISVVSVCSECSPSKDWLGLNSPIEKIRTSGLWLVQGLNRPIPSEWDYAAFQRTVLGV